ncbi:MAG: (d)CMP kinase [Christensenellales bacterium]
MFSVAIDGLAGCGKSSLALRLAKNLGFRYFNTGAMYRGITCEYLRIFGETAPNEEKMAKLLKDLQVKISFEGDNQRVIVNGIDQTPYLRREVVSNTTPLVSGYEGLRDKVREIQREFAREYNCVMEGRDIGSVVLKNADVKIYLTATSRERAKRRFAQMANDPARPSLEEVLKDIEERDAVDKTREHGKLLVAPDAIVVDNSNLTLEQTVAFCEKLIREKMTKKGL